MSTTQNVTKTSSLILALTSAALVTGASPVSHANFLPVYVGPNVVSSDPFGTSVNGAGTAIGNNGGNFCNDDGCSLLMRGFRWNASGTTMLAGLDADPNGFSYSRAYSLNDAGTVVGTAIKYDGAGNHVGNRAVRWAPRTNTATELPNLGLGSDGSTRSTAFAINAAGMIVGNSTTDGGFRAVRWDASGTAVTELGHLGAPGGFTHAVAVAVNASGAAAGSAFKHSAFTMLGTRAVRWDASTTAATELLYPTPISGTLHSQATAINDAGTVVGYGQMWDQSAIYVGGDAVRWDAAGAAASLETPAPIYGEFTQGIPRAINDDGTTVGAVEEYFRDETGYPTYPVGSRALRWDTTNTTATVLGNLGQNPSGFTDSNAYAINSAGFTVGYATWYGVGSLYGQHAVYWGDDGAAVDLNSLIDPTSGWLLTRAFAISDTGWITGVGQFDSDGPGGEDPYPYHILIHVPATAMTLPGDFNSDGTVDAADYVVWRKGVGIAPTQENYNLWRANFGQTAGTGTGANANAVVPEPATSLLLMLTTVGWGLRQRRAAWKALSTRQ